jgi:hypothetical protein
MDDLDRLYHELVDSVRRQRPGALLKPVTVHEVYERLVPYRRLRNVLGFRSNEDYETALTRLLSGERGYLSSDGEMQSELQAGLGELLPDIRRYRSFPEARVWLNPAEIPPPGDIRYAPPEVRERAVADLDVDTADPLDDGPVSGAAVEPDLAADRSASPVDAGIDAMSEIAGETAPAAMGRCPHCAGEPPENAVFCPFCGSRLSVETCGACGAELEPTWHYCAACGKPND